MDDSKRAPARGLKTNLKTAGWATALVVMALLAVGVALDTSKLGAPGAPVVLRYVTLSLACVVTLMLLPPVFRQLPRSFRVAVFVGAFVTLLVFGEYANETQAAWERTPQGARELAATKREKEKAAADRAKADVQRQADEAAAAREAADAKLAEAEAAKPGICRSLTAQIIEMSQSGEGPKIIEVNDVQAEPEVSAEHPLECSGNAITSRGNMTVTFGLVHTPQGKDLVHYQLH